MLIFLRTSKHNGSLFTATPFHAVYGTAPLRRCDGGRTSRRRTPDGQGWRKHGDKERLCDWKVFQVSEALSQRAPRVFNGSYSLFTHTAHVETLQTNWAIYEMPYFTYKYFVPYQCARQCAIAIFLYLNSICHI